MPITKQDRESLRCAAVRTAAAHGYDAVIITARRGNTLASESYAIGVEPGAPELPSRETYRDALIEAVDRAEENCPVNTIPHGDQCGDCDVLVEPETDTDLEFLREMLDRFDKMQRDTTQREFVRQMIVDWIAELEERPAPAEPETDECKCGHDIGDHPHLGGCRKCVCAEFSLAEPETCENDWYCPTCRRAVSPDCVTHEETHDSRYGGCGNPVEPSRELYEATAPAEPETCETCDVLQVYDENRTACRNCSHFYRSRYRPIKPGRE